VRNPYRRWVVGEFCKYQCRDAAEFGITADVRNLWTKMAKIADAAAAAGRTPYLSASLLRKECRQIAESILRDAQRLFPSIPAPAHADAAALDPAY
jgi:hypothetical protein